MDAVEPPLNAKVEFSSSFGGTAPPPPVAASDGLGGGTGCSSSRNGGGCGIKLESKDVQPGHGEMNTVLSLPKQEGKLGKRYTKFLTNIPHMKRPKVEHSGTRADIEVKDIEHSTEISRTIKQRLGFEAKRIDKRSLRFGCRAKYDCFASKANLTNFDSSTCSTTHGARCIKSDILDSTSNLSLSDLLAGSYKHPSPSREKPQGAAPHSKDELLLSLKKVFSILSVHAPESSEDINLPASFNDRILAPLGDVSVCKPKDVLDKLALPPVKDLDTLLSSSSMKNVSLLAAVNCEKYPGATLPPFSWSHSQSGAHHRPSSESGKSAPTRSSSQCQWVRLKSHFASRESEGLASRHGVDNLIEEIEALKVAFGEPHDKKPDASSLNYSEPCQKSNNLLSSSKVSGSHSPSSVRAAEILCEMASDPRSAGARCTANMSVMWPQPLPQTTIKARKPAATVCGSDGPFIPPRPIEAAKGSTSHQPAKHRPPDRKPEFPPHANGAGKGPGPISWPVPVNGISVSSSSRAERTHHSNGERHSNHHAPPPMHSQLEKDYENQQKLKKAKLASSSCGAAGEWDRMRSTRRL